MTMMRLSLSELAQVTIVLSSSFLNISPHPRSYCRYKNIIFIAFIWNPHHILMDAFLKKRRLVLRQPFRDEKPRRVATKVTRILIFRSPPSFSCAIAASHACHHRGAFDVLSNWRPHLSDCYFRSLMRIKAAIAGGRINRRRCIHGRRRKGRMRTSLISDFIVASTRLKTFESYYGMSFVTNFHCGNRRGGGSAVGAKTRELALVSPPAA